MNIGMQEIFLLSIIALIVLGPERLPQAVKSTAIWINRFKQIVNDFKSSVEQELNAEEIRREIHNENVMKEISDGRRMIDNINDDLQQTLSSIESTSNKATEMTHKENRNS